MSATTTDLLHGIFVLMTFAVLGVAIMIYSAVNSEEDESKDLFAAGLVITGITICAACFIDIVFHISP